MPTRSEIRKQLSPYITDSQVLKAIAQLGLITSECIVYTESEADAIIAALNTPERPNPSTEMAINIKINLDLNALHTALETYLKSQEPELLTRYELTDLLAEDSEGEYLEDFYTITLELNPRRVSREQSPEIV